MQPRFKLAVLILGAVMVAPLRAEEKQSDLLSSLVFHASFDGSLDASVTSGSGSIYTADSQARDKVMAGNHRDDVTIVPDGGKFGDALHFSKKSKQLLYYRGDEIQLPDQDGAATISLWLKLDPDEDLEPGYCDPLQITDKTWNDASLFIDFDKELPRDFRLGVFPDFKRWNPAGIDWDKIPLDKRPMVTVKRPSFSRDEWTHVAFTVTHINSSDEREGTATLYLNGERQGTLRQPMQFTWDRQKLAIMIGINYIGYLDDLAIFNRALSPAEIQELYKRPQGLSMPR